MVARAGYSRFCYCPEVGGRATKLAEPDDNTVRYCQVRNIIAANWRGWLVWLWATRMACPRSRAVVRALCFRCTRQMDACITQQHSHTKAA